MNSLDESYREYSLATLYVLRGGNVPWFMCWFRHCINCLFMHLLNFLPPFLPSLLFSFLVLFSYLFPSVLVYFLIYLSTASRIDLFCYQAGGCRRWPDLALVFRVHFMFVVYFFTDACLLLLCLFSFFSTKPEIGWEERLRNDLFCVGWDVKP